MLCHAVEIGENWTAYNGDCCELVREVPNDSVGFSVYSPPFASLFNYSDNLNCMSNCADDAEFFEHYRFLVQELYRVMMPGRCVAVHCMNLPKTIQRDGVLGMRDFRGDIIRCHESCGFVYHSEVVVWKCPVVAVTRTKAIGLLHKQLLKDSSISRQGMPDYVVTFRKPGKNPAPIAGPLDHYAGEELPSDVFRRYQEQYDRFLIGQAEIPDAQDFMGINPSIEIWQKYASPVWMDIRQGRVLNNFRDGSTGDEVRHLCVAKGSLVLTQVGHIPIEDVLVGDMVLTHLGRWRKVTAKRCNGVKPVVHVKAQGVPFLKVTPDHKLWTRSGVGPGRWPGMTPSRNHPRAQAKNSHPDWMMASETLASYVNLKLPPVEESGYSIEEWWVIGRWLGDGHKHTRKRKDGSITDSLFISCSHKECDSLVKSLGGYAGTICDTGTANSIRLKDRDGRLREMLAKCGRKAHEKRLPREALSLDPVRSAALLSGYLSADGHWNDENRRWMGSSVSRALLLGMSMVAQRVHGVVSAVYAGRKGGISTIQGREVRTKDDWIFSIPPKNLSGFVLEDGGWKKVRSVDECGEEEVWDLQVEEDESFTVEGCVVHNCPLQLDVIERCLQLWSKPGDTVLSPFMGVGSEGVCSINMDRKFMGFELKDSYFRVAVQNLQVAAAERNQGRLF